jgi:hypothetical protein
MAPSQVIEELKKGNERFRMGKMATRDYLAERRSSSTGQYPAAVILVCVDSRVPAEIAYISLDNSVSCLSLLPRVMLEVLQMRGPRNHNRVLHLNSYSAVGPSCATPSKQEHARS